MERGRCGCGHGESGCRHPGGGRPALLSLAMLYEIQILQIQIQGNMYKDNISIVIYLALML